MPTVTPKAVIFDLDGTILDTEQMWALATQQMLEARDIPYTEELKHTIHNAVHGLSPIHACIELNRLVGLHESPEALALEKRQRAYELIQGNIRFIPGFLSFLARVNELGLKTAVATNCSTPFVELADKEVNLKKLFNEHIYNPAHTAYRCKPLPDVYIYAARQLGVAPSECIAIEDSAAGITSAVAAGMYCIGINTADNHANLSRANLIVETYAQIKI